MRSEEIGGFAGFIDTDAARDRADMRVRNRHAAIDHGDSDGAPGHVFEALMATSVEVLAVPQGHDLIGDRGKRRPVRDDHHGSSGERLPQTLRDDLLGSASSADVGSSRINTLGLRSNARASATRCLSPAESARPRSARDGRVAFGKAANQFIESGLTRCGFDLSGGRFRPRVARYFQRSTHGTSAATGPPARFPAGCRPIENSRRSTPSMRNAAAVGIRESGREDPRCGLARALAAPESRQTPPAASRNDAPFRIDSRSCDNVTFSRAIPARSGCMARAPGRSNNLSRGVEDLKDPISDTRAAAEIPPRAPYGSAPGDKRRMWVRHVGDQRPDGHPVLTIDHHLSA